MVKIIFFSDLSADSSVSYPFNFAKSKELETTCLWEDLNWQTVWCTTRPFLEWKPYCAICWERHPQTALPSSVSSLDEESHQEPSHGPALGSWPLKADQCEGLKTQALSPFREAEKDHPNSKAPYSRFLPLPTLLPNLAVLILCLSLLL